jgi:hypothetical protein
VSWIAEVQQLHHFFESWFAGREASMQRAEAALDDGFTSVGPDGVARSRDEILDSIRRGKGQNPALRITTSDYEEMENGPDLIVARYIEHHHREGDDTHRISTVVFRRSPSTPNGVSWLSVHETWMAAG